MNYLLDTHVFLWMLAEPHRLQDEAVRAITNPDNAVFVSAVTAVEIAIKTAVGKLQAPSTLYHEIASRGLAELPLRYTHGEVLSSLSSHHADPFDRMLIAQAVAENLRIITHDKKFEPYPVTVLWT